MSTTPHDIRGKVVLIAGGAKNLGGLLAFDLAQQGAKAVAIHYNSASSKADADATVAAIEKAHEERYRALLKNIEDAKVFSRVGEQVWICRNCGHVHVGPNAPVVCPVCAHPQAYFELRSQNY